jgi:lysine 2,3-aminomutase
VTVKALTLMPATKEEEFADWKWQQRSAIRTVEQLLAVFPGLPEATAGAIRANMQQRRFQFTPYYLTLIRRGDGGDAPVPDDPMWKQVAPTWTEPAREEAGSYDYDGTTENWEMPTEMVTPIAQHKYDDRIIVRLANVCHAYCQFCYEALRTLEKETSKASFQQEHWDATVRYVREHAAVHEVILSGGEPLLHSDAQLAQVLADLRGVGRPIAVRLHTRALTFNPYRITDALVSALREHGLNAIGLHVTHPHELTPQFEAAVAKLRTAVPVLFANTPLLRGVNDDLATMRELGMRLYLLGVRPGYLYHFMPNSPGSEPFRTTVQAGVDIVRGLKRRVSNLAVPEYVLPHHTGKHTMPLLAPGEAHPVAATDADGYPVVRFTNWRGEVVEYPDVLE